MHHLASSGYSTDVTFLCTIALSSAHSLVAIWVSRLTHRANANSSSSEEKRDELPTTSGEMPSSLIVSLCAAWSDSEPPSSLKMV